MASSDWSRRAFIASSLAMAGGVRGQGDGGVVFLGPGDEAYEAARQPFNSLVTLKPALIAPCRSEAHVAAAIRRAADQGMPVAVKSGGHAFHGYSLNQGGLVVELSGMHSLSCDAGGKLKAGPGLKLREVYSGLKPHQRFLPAGSCGGVGLSGLTLGGGYGLFSREFGLTCDHLQRVRLVDGRGQIRDSKDEPDLLWACRGGGNGNFGVITSMEFKTRIAPRQLASWNLRKRFKDPEELAKCIELWFEVAGNLPNPIFSALVLNGNLVTVLLTSTRNSRGPAFQKAGKALISAGFSSKGPADTEFHRAIKRFEGRDGPLPFNNVSAGYYRSFADIESIANEMSSLVLNTPGLIYQINTLGGEIASGPDAAYPHREMPMLGELQAYWDKGPMPERLAAGHAKFKQLLASAGITRHYRNYPDPDLKDWEGCYYAAGAMRLKKIKAALDPDDRIWHPQSIKA